MMMSDRTETIITLYNNTDLGLSIQAEGTKHSSCFSGLRNVSLKEFREGNSSSERQTFISHLTSL